jgi:hypothetical protein
MKQLAPGPDRWQTHKRRSAVLSHVERVARRGAPLECCGTVRNRF